MEQRNENANYSEFHVPEAHVNCRGKRVDAIVIGKHVEKGKHHHAHKRDEEYAVPNFAVQRDWQILSLAREQPGSGVERDERTGDEKEVVGCHQ